MPLAEREDERKEGPVAPALWSREGVAEEERRQHEVFDRADSRESARQEPEGREYEEQTECVRHGSRERTQHEEVARERRGARERDACVEGELHPQDPVQQQDGEERRQRAENLVGEVRRRTEEARQCDQGRRQ